MAEAQPIYGSPFAGETGLNGIIGRICMAALLGLRMGIAAAQSPATPATTVPAEPSAFEVVSIRANRPHRGLRLRPGLRRTDIT
jgi:hypothetical protein